MPASVVYALRPQFLTGRRVHVMSALACAARFFIRTGGGEQLNARDECNVCELGVLGSAFEVRGT